MWTNENRAKYNRDHLRYPSDLTDDEWALVEPFIPPAKPGGGKRQAGHARGHERRHVHPEHRLPMALPSEGFSAAQHGPRLLHLVALRRRAGSHSSRALRRMPRAGGTRSQPHRLHHRQSKRQERRKRGACIDPHGFDAGKLIKGKKRHILVDTLGLLLHAIVHSAGIQDRDGGILLLATLFGQFPFLQKLFADSAYQGPIFGNALAKILPCLETEIVKRSDRKPRASCSYPSAGSSNARSPGSTVAAASPRTGKISTATPSPS